MTIYNKNHYKNYSKKDLLDEIVNQNYLIDNLIVQKHELKDQLNKTERKDIKCP